jgi:proline iminopeptidase
MPKRLSTPIGVYPSQKEALHRLPLPGAVDMAYRTLGGAGGAPWLVLHGGPGSGASPALWQAFNLERHRIWVPDQRGSGASRPRGTLRGQHIRTLVADLERLRTEAQVPQWHVLGGSWGATLAMAYATQHPQAVASLVVRGSFTASMVDVSRLLGAMTRATSRRPLVPLNQVQPLLHRLSQLFRNGTPTPAQTGWIHRWQNAERQLALHGQWRAWLHSNGLPPNQRNALRRSWAQLNRAQRKGRVLVAQPPSGLLAKYRIQAHHLARRCRLRPGDWHQGLCALAQQGTPVTWVHGIFDAVCPPDRSLHSHAVLKARSASSAWAWAHAGHLGIEPDMLRALQQSLKP